MPFKSIDEIQSFPKYKSVIKADLGRITASPVKFYYYEKFKFHEKVAPLLLVGDVPTKVLDDLNKAAKGQVKGRCHLMEKNIHFEKASGGDMKWKSLEGLVKEVGSDKGVTNWGAEEPKELAGKELGEKFQGEDTKMGWRTEDPARKESNAVTTKYDRTATEREKSQVTPTAKGLLKDSGGAKLDGKQGFVVDPKTGQVHVFKPDAVEHLPDGTKQTTHHSTPLAGAPVAGAGHLVTQGGRVKEIHDDSGHYKPSAAFTLQVVQQLEALGVSLKDKKLVGAKGKDVDEAYVEEYERIQELIEALQIAYDKKKNDLGDRFDPADPKLFQEREKIQGKLAKLRALNVAPANRPAKVQLQGKTVALTAEEFQGVKGDLTKINALLKTKTGGRENVLRANIDPRTLQGLDSLNREIGRALAITLTTQQFAQTGGNEAAIRAKADVVAELNLKAQRLPIRPAGAAKDAIAAATAAKAALEEKVRPKSVEEQIDALGGKSKILKLGFPERMLPQLEDDDRLAFLENRIDLAEARKRASN